MAEYVGIQGLDGLLASLKAMPAELVSKSGGPVAFGMRKGGNLIRDEARDRAPKATGFMASQIVTRRASASKTRQAGANEYFTVGIRLGKKKKYANTKRNRRMGRVGGLYETAGWAFYWRFLEFGTKFMKATPFLTPAAEKKGPEAAVEIAKQIRVGIDRIAQKYGWKA